MCARLSLSCTTVRTALWLTSEALILRRKTSLLRALQRREKKIRSLVRSPSAKLVRQIAVLDDDNSTRPLSPSTHHRAQILTPILFSCAGNTVPLSTDGIEINPWSLAMPWGNDAPMMELSAWDFAGTFHCNTTTQNGCCRGC